MPGAQAASSSSVSHEGELCFRYSHFFSFLSPNSGGEDLDGHGDGGVADALDRAEEAHHVAHVYRFMKNDFFDGHGDKLLAHMTRRFDGACLVDVAQENATENGSVTVSVARHHGDSYYRLWMF